MDEKTLAEANDLFRELERIWKFNSRYNEFPVRDVERVVGEMRDISRSLYSVPENSSPLNMDVLIESELKRRLVGEAFSLEQAISPKTYDFDTIVNLYNIPREDIHNLKKWLMDNKEKVTEIIGRLYHEKEISKYRILIPSDILAIKDNVENVAREDIKIFYNALSSLLPDKIKNNTDNFLVVPTTMERSYFNSVVDIMAISIPNIYYLDESREHVLDKKNMIAIYGHEFMGHALNAVMTRESDLPYFMKVDTIITNSTKESVAQHYGRLIFDILKGSPKVLDQLSMNEKEFEAIYQDYMDTQLMEEYRHKLMYYAITVMADKNFGHYLDEDTVKRRIEAIREVSINPKFPNEFVENRKYSYDNENNLHWKIVSELIYCAQPVERALKLLNENGVEDRETIDRILLTGYWTPTGLEQNTMLKLKKYK